MKTCLVAVILLLYAANVSCRRDGAPVQACANLTPGHGATPIDPSNSPPPYYIVASELPFVGGMYMYTAGTTYSIRLVAIGDTFRGFLIQAQAPGGGLIGSFNTASEANAQTLTCSSDPDSTITHTSAIDKTEISVQWTAPTGSNGVVMFRYSVVRTFSSYYVNLNAADYRLNCNFTATPIGNHSLIFRSPSGCDRSSCDYYVGLSPNAVDSTYLDVYLEGTAAGWIAIGFSLNTLMENDDVLGCRVNSGSVVVVDTWNPSPRRAANVLDNSQSGLCVQSASFTNGRISCMFSRTITVTDVGQDYNLNNSYWLFFGRRLGDQGTFASLGFHGAADMIPRVSSQQYNPVIDVADESFCPFRANAIAEFPLIYRWPDGCLLGSCDYLVGLGPNPVDSTYLDVYLEGAAAGWLAIGFSNNTSMDDDDVLGCYVNSGSVIVADAWNPSPRRTPNMFDDTQGGLCVYSTSFSNGRLSCRFSRTVNITDPGQDYDLDDMFYLLFARRTQSPGTSGTGFSIHSMVPRISMNQTNPLQDNNSDDRCPIQATSLGGHRLIFRSPSGCDRSNCDYYVGLSPNAVDSTYLDVYLEGNASGWIAIGFSLNTQMEDDDVLGCRVSSGSVVVVDTWNPSPRRAPNELDDTQDGLCVQSASFTNGRISCMFSRTINITNVGQDYDLNNSYWLFFGRRLGEQNATLDSLGFHNVPSRLIPVVSDRQYNPVLDTNLATGCPQPPPNDGVFTFRRGTTGAGYYFASRVNPDNPNYLDMTLEADTTGWVGIGFSTDRLMGNDDVLACHRSPSSNMVAVVDTWNPNPRYTANQLDPNQNGVCTHSAQFVNGRITCTFSRLIVGMQMDHNLNDSLFQLYATSSTRGVGSLARHDVTPDVTAEPVIVTMANETVVDDFPRRQLTKVHGILMLIAWPLLAVTAIFFGAWMKPAIAVEWFQVHRAFMIVSLFTTALGFIFIFVANARNTAVSPGLISFACGSNTAHFAIGFLVFILQIVNPIIAIFRCKPDDSKRWVFNIFHGTLIGFAAELFALVNVGLGIALFEAGGCGTRSASQYTILWVYIAFVAFLLILQFTLFVVFTVSALKSSPEKRRQLAPSLIKYFFPSNQRSEKYDIEMTNRNDTKKADDPPAKKPPSEDAPIRWGSFVIFMVGTFGLMVALVIMIAVN